MRELHFSQYPIFHNTVCCYLIHSHTITKTVNDSVS